MTDGNANLGRVTITSPGRPGGVALQKWFLAIALMVNAKKSLW